MSEVVDMKKWRTLGALAAALACSALVACTDAEQASRMSEATEIVLPEPSATSPLAEGEVRPLPKRTPGNPVAYLRFETDAPRRLRFRCDTETLTGCMLELFDADGTRKAFGGTDPSMKRVDFYARLPSAGTYYLGVSGSEKSAVGTFQYQLTNLGIDAVADTPEEATPVEPDQTFEDGLQGSGDTDAYSFAVQAHRIYELECTSPTPTPNVTVRLLLPGMSSPQNLQGLPPIQHPITRATESGTGSVIIGIPLAQRPVDLPVSYSCSVLEHLDDAPDELDGPARELPVNTEVSGRSDWPGDVDVFAATLPARHHLSAIFQCELGYCPLKVYDPSGALQDTVPAPFGTALWTSRIAGEYRFRVPASYGSYTLKLSDLGLDDVGDSADDATSVEPEAPLDGKIGVAWDQDVFVLTAPAGRMVTMSCSSTGTGPFAGVTLLLADESGTQLDNRYVPEAPVEINMTVPPSGRFLATFGGVQDLRTYHCDWSILP